jgi:hypothetical protein
MNPALSMIRAALPTKRISYSNEDFDIVSRVAFTLTDSDRKAGKDAPAFGYSAANYKLAQDAMREWRG